MVTMDIDKLVDEMTPEQLPDVITDIAALIGYSNALLIVQNLGGVDFNIPKGGNENSRRAQTLVDIVGQEAADKIMKAFGGAKLYIPRCQAALIFVRNKEFRTAIEMAVASGMSQTAALEQYAPQFGFSERWAYVVLSRRDVSFDDVSSDGQMSLFTDTNNN
ncbi:MAG: Mor transcription activator family protein [Psychrobacter sp.]|nr:Mor transcription activator family protein [Psychrobacter sp.]